MKAIRVIAGVLAAGILFTGCSAADNTGSGSAPSDAGEDAVVISEEESIISPEIENIVSSGEESSVSSAEEVAVYSVEEEDADELNIENISNNPEGHYTFRPHVFSSRYLERFGESTRDAFFSFCDALRSGEESFACPDQSTAEWCAGRLSNYFFPPAYTHVEAGLCENGRAAIVYLTPKEEFLDMVKNFEAEITDILNDCLGDDYCDFEKILALYEYMTTRYTYNYEMAENNDPEEIFESQSPYRCLQEKNGICNGLAALYDYLLLQAGIDSEEMGGMMHYPDGTSAGHAWVFVTLDGRSYHVDPTFGLTETRPPLCWFMMTDAVREGNGEFKAEEFSLAGLEEESRNVFDFEAVSEDYSPLWEGSYIGMDRSTKEVVYYGDESLIKRFPYSGKG